MIIMSHIRAFRNGSWRHRPTAKQCWNNLRVAAKRVSGCKNPYISAFIHVAVIINDRSNFFRTDTAFFLSLLRPGDLVEFERDGYQHWAVYIGNMVKMMIRNK